MKKGPHHVTTSASLLLFCPPHPIKRLWLWSWRQGQGCACRCFLAALQPNLRHPRLPPSSPPQTSSQPQAHGCRLYHCGPFWLPFSAPEAWENEVLIFGFNWLRLLQTLLFIHLQEITFSLFTFKLLLLRGDTEVPAFLALHRPARKTHHPENTTNNIPFRKTEKKPHTQRKSLVYVAF